MHPRAHNVLSYGGAVGALLLGLVSPAVTGGEVTHNRVAVILWVVHFVRRCAKTLWLFEFGGDDVPAADCAQEYAYYWGFAAAIAAALASPDSVPTSPTQTAVGVALWCAAEAANHTCHRTLARRAASKGADGRKTCVPAGERFLFSRVACPHYTFEVSSWFAFAVVANGARSACAFATVGAILMSSWALQRHEQYAAASADYWRYVRYPIVPGLNVPLPRALTDALAR